MDAFVHYMNVNSSFHHLLEKQLLFINHLEEYSKLVCILYVYAPTLDLQWFFFFVFITHLKNV